MTNKELYKIIDDLKNEIKQLRKELQQITITPIHNHYHHYESPQTPNINPPYIPYCTTTPRGCVINS